jgi:riboflavin synthase
MFTGIIEALGVVTEVVSKGSNRTFRVESPLSPSFKVDQSVSHNGVCLTVEAVHENAHIVTAIDETLQKTSLGTWENGSLVNLEQCLPMNGRLDGHFVQGHVDSTGTCIARIEKDGSWEFTIQFPRSFAALMIEKGSISLNGISLTAFNVTKDSFTVAIIPYTFEHTNIRDLNVGGLVNLEFDLIGKYITRKLSLANS